MSSTFKTGIVSLILLVVLAASSSASAQVTLEFLGDGYALDMSADGTVIVGNTNGSYETFRWTAQTGVVNLGMPANYLGKGAGSPDVSKDGTRVSATILGADSTYVTQGLWIEGQGWQDLMPPTLPDGGLMDSSYGSAWGMSGDGRTVTGLYWRPGVSSGTAHGSRWTQETGVVSMVDAGSADSRINDADYDGNVLVGWSANPGFHNWWPTVWVDGVQTVLDTLDNNCMVDGVSDDGTILLGQNTDPANNNTVSAAVWRWNGSGWDYQLIGALFATHPIYGAASLTACTPDGSLMVGYNAFDPGDSAGILWTQETGLVNVEQWLLAQGVTLPPDFTIQSLTAVSDNGLIICGFGKEMVAPYTSKFFRILMNGPTAAPVARRSARLHANYPNPFNPATTIPVVLDRSESVELGIYDLRGQKIRTLHTGFLSEGQHDFLWNGTDQSGGIVSSGSYFARLRGEDGTEQSRRMILLK